MFAGNAVSSQERPWWCRSVTVCLSTLKDYSELRYINLYFVIPPPTPTNTGLIRILCVIVEARRFLTMINTGHVKFPGWNPWIRLSRVKFSRPISISSRMTATCWLTTEWRASGCCVDVRLLVLFNGAINCWDCVPSIKGEFVIVDYWWNDADKGKP